MQRLAVFIKYELISEAYVDAIMHRGTHGVREAMEECNFT